MPTDPKIILVGGQDVDARLGLMHYLKETYSMSAFGSQATLHEKFQSEGFDYTKYTLAGGVKPILDLFTLGQLFLIFRRLKPQIVHAFDTKPCVWARLAARLAGVPGIIGTLPGLGSLYINDTITRRLLRSIYQWLQRLACHFSNLTVFQNHDDANYFIEIGIVSPQKVVVIPGSGVDTEVFSPSQVPQEKKTQLKREMGIGSDEIVVTMISRIIRSKGILEFIAATQNINKYYPNVRFLLIGSEDKNSLDRLSTEELTQLKQAVTWPGPSQDIPAILALSDIFVLPSAYREGIPRVLLEAASMGLPIVTTDSPGCREVVENGVNGFLVPVHDSVALSQAILRLVEQTDLRKNFGQLSRQRAVERFDLSVIAKQTRAVYQQVLSLQTSSNSRAIPE